jgi:hypothetical protein
MSIETMKQALEALENPWKAKPEGVANAITALRQAIEQAERQEPVAMVMPVATVISETGDESVTMSWWHEPALPVGTQLYTSPPQRQPLTDEEIAKCYETTGHYQTLRPQDRFAVFALARAIEAKLKGEA